ncbi:polysaccharide lyase family 7 protein [Pseudomonas syringae]|nr:polysaccharide lyase family 7 protein [Pseudomonas syringae]MCF5070644.1 polysaccharide lyase family 7 protein [Pseudomonas syringae]
MPVDLSRLMITTPVPTSPTNPVALELMGDDALARLPDVISRLPDGSVRFSAPTLGASSKSTHRTRCEWKEPVYWTLESAAVHVNRQQMVLTQVNALQKVVIAQIHVKGNNNPPVKVFWNKGKISWGFRVSFNGLDPSSVTIADKVPLNMPFTVALKVTSAGQVTVAVTRNGSTVETLPAQLDNSWAGQRFNFHGGVYNQIDYTTSTPTTDGSVCIISDLTLTHGPA